MEQPKIYYPAVLVAAVIQFVIGAGWYTAFQGPWMSATGVTMEMAEHMTGGQIAMMYGGSFVAFALVYYVMAHFVGYMKATTAKAGAQTAFWAWLGYVATSLFVNGVYTLKPFSLWLMDGGYWLISMVIGGILLAVWRKKEAAPAA